MNRGNCCGGNAPRSIVIGRIVGVSSSSPPVVLVERPNGEHVAVAASQVSPVELHAFARRVGVSLPRGLGSLGDLADDFNELVNDLQANGRDWFFARIREITGLGVGYQTLASKTDNLMRPDWSADLRERAAEMRTVQDGLYWVVDTYLGGVDALPNIVPPPPGARAGVRYQSPARGFVPPTPGVAPAVLALALQGLGIVTGAALLAYISSVAADYAVRARQVDAAQANNNPDLLPKPDKGVIEQTTDLVGKFVVVGLLALAWINRNRIAGAARNVGRRTGA